MNGKERLEMARGLALDAVLSVDNTKSVRVYDELQTRSTPGAGGPDVQFLIIALRD